MTCFVDVNIVDREGRPVSTLKAGEFALTVDGKPRKIASAQFIAVTRDVERAPVQPADYSSNAAATGGRLIMLVVDQGNIGTSRGKFALESASRFISRLQKSDRVGLTTVPGTAYSEADEPVEAVRALDPYLATHPEDQERLFVALKSIYRARSTGQGIGSAEEDRGRFQRYADAYAAAGGTHQALVEQWKRFIVR